MNKLILCLTIACWAASSRVLAVESSASLTLKQARQIALNKHPRITVAELLALAASQSVDQARSAYFPVISGNLAAVRVDKDNTRMVSAGLPVSAVVDRGGVAITLNQLITDFGRTSNLTASAKLKARSEEQNLQATRAAILLEVDNAYLGVLRAESLKRVGESTVKARSFVRDQVAALEKNELRSTLDLSIAEVSLQEAVLLLSRAENELEAGFATLAALLDQPNVMIYHLSDEPDPTQPVAGLTELIGDALRNRPDLLKLQFDRDAALKFAQAEQALRYPTITAQGAAGELPYHDATTNQSYAAGGIIVNWPIFNGKLYSAKQKEAALRAQASSELLHEATNNVVRDVRIAWSSANNAFRNLSITAKLSQQANRSLDLAKARYDNGGSGMVELSQAQLSLTSAEIDEANARYEYLLRRAILEFQTGSLK